MNRQQLQIARAALWHQTAASDAGAPLRTLDDAARWLDDIGFCLFLPRHTQLPAPAPSLVEACLGAARATPAPGEIAGAMDLLTRLVEERRAVPLSLLGTFSEQPDFLVTPEVLPWVAAVRGDRQWKSAPEGRTTPIVTRAFEILDREGELTVAEVRERLGREITEAAALRALLTLWTMLRATPVYAGGQATRWTLLKNRHAAQLATAANTSQTTALSALLSLYLRSAVAATAEEAEIFLSPVTARSRIREVLHGMMATRQLEMTTVASQTLLFVEGSLPETLAEPEPEVAIPRPPPPVPAPRPPFRQQPRPPRRELPGNEARPRGDRERPWQKKPAAAAGRKPWENRPRPELPGNETRPRGDRERPWQKKPAAAGRKLWENRPRPERKPFETERPAAAPRRASDSGAQQERPDRRERRGQPWRGSGSGKGPARPDRFRSEGRERPGRPGAKPWQRRETSFRGPKFQKKDREGPAGQGARKERGPRSGSSQGPGKFPPKRRFPGSGRPGQPGGSAPSNATDTRRPFRPGKPSFRRSDRSERPFRAGKPKNKFRKPSPGGRKPRKNRSQKETPE